MGKLTLLTVKLESFRCKCRVLKCTQCLIRKLSENPKSDYRKLLSIFELLRHCKHDSLQLHLLKFLVTFRTLSSQLSIKYCQKSKYGRIINATCKFTYIKTFSYIISNNKV